eukprot:4363576-Pyramimonas_sp.AAC.1
MVGFLLRAAGDGAPPDAHRRPARRGRASERDGLRVRRDLRVRGALRRGAGGEGHAPPGVGPPPGLRPHLPRSAAAPQRPARTRLRDCSYPTREEGSAGEDVRGGSGGGGGGESEGGGERRVVSVKCGRPRASEPD